MPHELNIFWYYNRRLFQEIIFRATSKSLRCLLKNEKYLAAKPGMISSLHTWDQQLKPHLHIHSVITAGGLTEESQWKELKYKDFLLPVQVLSKLYRGKFIGYLRKALRKNLIIMPPGQSQASFLYELSPLYKKQWHVEIMPVYEHGRGITHYLALYLKRGPMSSYRIKKFDGSGVTFIYKKRRSVGNISEIKEAKISLEDFVKRYLFHVPLPRFQMVRSYGLYSNRTELLNSARKIFNQKLYERMDFISWKQDLIRELEKENKCPYCESCYKEKEILLPQACSPPKNEAIYAA